MGQGADQAQAQAHGGMLATIGAALQRAIPITRAHIDSPHLDAMAPGIPHQLRGFGSVHDKLLAKLATR